MGRIVAALAILCAVELVVLLVVATRSRDSGELSSQDVQALIDEPELRAEVVQLLAEEALGLYDSHNDPQVGFVLQPGARGRRFKGTSVDTNTLGMREREIAVPRPEGLVRVVLLGDSFVFGSGVEADERFGVLLERELRARTGARDLRVEVLHLGVSGWNVLAECAFLRRQLGQLQPDLVVQLSVANDLNDANGVRGYGALAPFTPQHRERADARLSDGHPRTALGVRTGNLLAAGLDHESKRRFDGARREIERLAEAVEAYGGRYLLLLHWGSSLAVAEEQWAERLPPARVAALPPGLKTDRRHILGPNDYHWNPRGHEHVARLLYALIRERGLLPRLDPGPWPEAEAALAAEADPGGPERRRDELIETRMRLVRKLSSSGPGLRPARAFVHGGYCGVQLR